ncbi:hypothetical protein CBER1_04958 [Cercospora berteroae]|uniref:C2H2-type domain-containing protein n=1 Tax=Cercospora berteroae TaxID=357750 RepID=A0A2S6CJC9_9PEZI|nr:hypothetical protein CBER1_04958 [Cercospora berteroae]
MAGRVRLIASATTDELAPAFHVLNLIDLLRRLQMVLCLTLKRRRYTSQSPRDSATLLENILRTDRFKQFAGNNFEVVEVQDGREWRGRTTRPDAPSLVKPMDHKFLKLPDYSLLEDIPDNCFDLGGCEEIIDEPRQFLLVIHPEGPDNIELFEVPERIATPFPLAHAAAAELVKCANCKYSFSKAELSQTCCFFHSGMTTDRYLPCPDSSDSEDGDEANSSSTEFHGTIWACCEKEYGAPGCTVERRHLMDSEVVPERGEDGALRKESWDLGKRLCSEEERSSESER